MGRHYSLGNQVVFDKLKREIIDGDNVAHIGGREAAILTMLCENGNQVLRKNEIHEHVWGKVYVSETSLTKAISNLRKSFVQFTGISCEIKTIPKEGYMLIIENYSPDTLNAEILPDLNFTKSKKVFPEHLVNTSTPSTCTGLHSSVSNNQRIFWITFCFTSTLITTSFATAIIMVLR